MSDPTNDQVPATTRRRLPAGMIPWKPGQSGNPSGKNAVTGLMSKLRDACDNGERLIQVLEEALLDANPSVRLKAVELWFERGWGKAVQPVIVGGSDSKPAFDLSKLSQEELLAFKAIMAKVAGVDIGIAQPP